MFHSFFGGPTILIFPGHHSPLEVLLRCRASVSRSIPVKGSAWSVGEVVALQPAWSHVCQGSSPRHLALFPSSWEAQLLSSAQPWPSTQPCRAGVHSNSSHNPTGKPSCLSYCMSPCQRSGQCKNYFPFAAERARRNIQLINRMSWLEQKWHFSQKCVS